MNDLWVVGLTGAAVGGAVGWPLLRWPAVTAAGTNVPVRWLGAMLLLGAAAAGLIGLSHSDLLGPSMRGSVTHILYSTNVIFWASVVMWVRRATGRSGPLRAELLIAAVPLIAYVIAAVQVGRAPQFIWLLPAGTLASLYLATVWIRSGASRSTSLDAALISRMIALAIALNAAQAIRTLWPQVPALREIVPLTMTAGFLSIATLAVRRVFAAAPGSRLAATRPYAKSSLDVAAAERLLDAVDRGMRDEHWYRDPQLSLGTLAARLEVGPHVLSQALNQIRGRNFNDYVAAFRVDEARNLLTDPASDRFTIDALAEAAGFASRSAFYKAFKAHEGMTPTAYRAFARRHPEE